MILLTRRSSNGLVLGVKTPAGILDVVAARASLGADAPGALADVIRSDASGVQKLAELVRRATGRADLHRVEAEITYGPCVPPGGKIVCVGLNYRRHAEESRMAIPETPILFGKFGNALAGPGDPIRLPSDDPQLDYEAELAIVIGRRAQGVTRDRALSHVFGYCNANDVSARGLQFRTPQWLLGKSLDGYCPVGPYLVTADAIPDPNRLAIRCRVNGHLRQDSSTADMIFPCPELIEYASRYMTLEPGDLILTGTPEGVAAGRSDKPWLRVGDRVQVEIEGLGALENVVK